MRLPLVNGALVERLGAFAPYPVSWIELTRQLSHSEQGRGLVRALERYRMDVRKLRLANCCQWVSLSSDRSDLNGSVVTLYVRPSELSDNKRWMSVVRQNPQIFQRASVRRTYSFDIGWIDAQYAIGAGYRSLIYWYLKLAGYESGVRGFFEVSLYDRDARTRFADANVNGGGEDGRALDIAV